MKLKLIIHSFIDVITNSSSEIFVTADSSTVTAIKELLNDVIKSVASDKSVDDIFEVSLDSGEITVTAKDPSNTHAMSAVDRLKGTNLPFMFYIDAQYDS